MDMSIADAAAKLNDLVRRAEAGEEVVLTRDGMPAVRLVAVVTQKRKSREDFLEAVRKIQEEAAKTMTPGPDAARSQDFLYDEYGLPV